MSINPEFDIYADDYDAVLAQSLAATGEAKDYFARGRIAYLAGLLGAHGVRARTALDFGCGTGSATPHLFTELAVERVVGVDMSPRSLAVARRTYDSYAAQFELLAEYAPLEAFDLAYCNGVFHHIPVGERARAVGYVFNALRPGGLFAFWENSPWNIGTRYVMSRCPFDRDAVTLTPPRGSPVAARRRI